MPIPFDQFEQHIDETILGRGLSYFENGRVDEPEEISPGMYETQVEGSEVYTVQLTLANRIITDYACDCPYDMGPICKHVVALIFYLQQDEICQLQRAKSTKQRQQTSKPKTVTQRIEEVLDKVSHEELKQFVRDKSVANPPFRNLFLAAFAQYSAEAPKEFYVKQVKAILRAASDRHGFIDWSSTHKVGNEIDELLASAQKQIDNGQPKSAILMATAVMEQLLAAFEFADDSDGELGGCIDAAFQLLTALAQKPPEEIRKMILDYCLTAFARRTYSGWDWHMDMLTLAASLVKTEVEVARIFELIESVYHSKNEIERIQKVKYTLLWQTRGESVAEAYLTENLENPAFRRLALQKALDNKNYERATVLATDGVKQDLSYRRRPVGEWHRWLLQIALAQHHTPQIVEYARLLFLNNIGDRPAHYQLLKQHVNPAKWRSFVEDLLAEIAADKQWVDTALMADIFISEAWWERLLELVEASPRLDVLDRYAQHLAKEYPDELVELYAEAVLTYMERSTSRSHYQEACRYIRKIIKLGAKRRAHEVIAFLRAKYPRRKALLEELNKI